jgi:hypothetical protein
VIQAWRPDVASVLPSIIVYIFLIQMLSLPEKVHREAASLSLTLQVDISGPERWAPVTRMGTNAWWHAQRAACSTGWLRGQKGTLVEYQRMTTRCQWGCQLDLPLEGQRIRSSATAGSMGTGTQGSKRMPSRSLDPATLGESGYPRANSSRTKCGSDDQDDVRCHAWSSSLTVIHQ